MSMETALTEIAIAATLIAVVAGLFVIGLIAWFAVSAARNNNG
jgi:hypothetical protein